MPPTTSADDTLIAAHLASGILAATMRVASVENPGSKSGKGDHFSKGCATRLCVLRRDCRTANREIDQDDPT